MLKVHARKLGDVTILRLQGRVVIGTRLDSVFEISSDGEVLSGASRGRPADVVETEPCLSVEAWC